MVTNFPKFYMQATISILHMFISVDDITKLRQFTYQKKNLCKSGQKHHQTS